MPSVKVASMLSRGRWVNCGFEVRVWTSNYFPKIYMDGITYLFSRLVIGLTDFPGPFLLTVFNFNPNVDK